MNGDNFDQAVIDSVRSGTWTGMNIFFGVARKNFANREYEDAALWIGRLFNVFPSNGQVELLQNLITHCPQEQLQRINEKVGVDSSLWLSEYNELPKDKQITLIGLLIQYYPADELYRPGLI